MTVEAVWYCVECNKHYDITQTMGLKSKPEAELCPECHLECVHHDEMKIGETVCHAGPIIKMDAHVDMSDGGKSKDRPSRCTRRDNPDHVCNCDCEGYEREIEQLQLKLDKMKNELNDLAELTYNYATGKTEGRPIVEYVKKRLAEI